MNWIKFKRRNTTKCKSFRAFHLTIIHHITILLHNLFLIYLPKQFQQYKPHPSISSKSLSSFELQKRRAKGLCYYTKHKCKAKLTLLVNQDDDSILGYLPTQAHARWGFISPTPPSLILQTPWTLPENRQICLNAMMGKINPETLRIHNFIIKNILMNGGNTHNFIQDRLFKYLDQ